jgi:hypothetical protein
MKERAGYKTKSSAWTELRTEFLLPALFADVLLWG